MTHTNDEEEYLTQHWLFNRENKMYKLTIKDNVYTIPKNNISLLAIDKAMENLYYNPNLVTEEGAIEYLESLGVKVDEIDE